MATALLSDLVERGLDPEQGMLFVIDGSKALRKAIRDVFGERAAVQHLREHTELGGPYTVPIAPDGGFKFDTTYQSTVGSFPSFVHLTINGHLNGGVVAAGSLVLTTSFSANGTQYSCNFGLQSWTAARTN